MVLKDYSRTNNSLNQAVFLPDSAHDYRIITASLWYPSEITASDQKATFADFMPTIELDSKKDYNSKDSIVSCTDKFADYYSIDKTHFLRLLNRSTEAYFNAKPLSVKYPLVIYIPGMNGFSFENHRLCELLAKQGHVVVSFNSKGSDSRWMLPTTMDYENQIRDVQFIIAKAHEWSFVNHSKICLIGHSIGGYVNILTKIRDSRIIALVSLDGSIIHDLDRCHEFVYNDLSKVNCPLLSVSTQELAKAKVYLDSMPYADRYYFQTPAFKHNEFKSLSYLLHPGLDTVKFNNYQALNKLVVSFISKVNNNTTQSEFEEIYKQLTNSGFLVSTHLTAIPDFSYFQREVCSTGFAHLSDSYKSILTQYPNFKVSTEELYHWGNSLRYSGNFNQAIEVYKLLVDLYPEDLSGYKGWARTLLLQNHIDEAILVYQQALKVNPNNESIQRKLNTLSAEKSKHNS